MKINLNLTKSLNPKTMGDILVYLESRPLGEVFALFTDITSQLAETEANGPIADINRPRSTAPGSGNANGGSDCIPLIPSES